MMTIQESDMEFGEYDDSCVFRIEKSAVYKDLSVCGIKTCEFVLLKDNSLFFIEAKSSCPNHFAANSIEEKKKKYDEYVSEIVQKMKDSIDLYAGMLLNRHNNSEISNTLKNGVNGSRNVVLVLVVKKAEKEWLVPFNDVFKKKLRKEIALWHVKNFLVINEEMAINMKLAKSVAV